MILMGILGSDVILPARCSCFMLLEEKIKKREKPSQSEWHGKTYDFRGETTF